MRREYRGAMSVTVRLSAYHNACHTAFVASLIVLANRGAPLSRGRGDGRAAHDRPPVIIVPGSLHSRLAVRAERDNAQCEGTGDNASEVAYVNWTQWRSRQSQRCWIDRMSLRLTTGQRFISPPGVDIEVIDGPTSDKFGSLSQLCPHATHGHAHSHLHISPLYRRSSQEGMSLATRY